ncbi:MAG TPA: protease inhibitor I42 family protein [bacterium]|nr:protease inhibitor I42 family protein [bacterium]
METELVVKSGDTFRIELKSNPTTGYEWFAKYDEMMLNLKRSEYISPQSQKMVGSPGKQVFIFQALKKGETIVEFTYQRSWEKDKPPVKIMKCKVMSK